MFYVVLVFAADSVCHAVAEQFGWDVVAHSCRQVSVNLWRSPLSRRSEVGAQELGMRLLKTSLFSFSRQLVDSNMDGQSVFGGVAGIC